MDDTIKHYCVYCLLFPNKKRYIGLTGQKPEYRWNNGEGYCYQTFVDNAIKKYGWNNIERIILKDELTKIEQYDLDGNFVSEFSCATEVAKLFNVKSCSHILECCRGERKTFHGYIWKFKD